MQVETLMQRLKDGDTMKIIAGELGLNPSTVQRKLKKLGYAYSNSTKEWSWNGEGEEPLSLDITESGPRQQSDVKTTTDSE
ncbi:hypothetical protein ACQVQ2_26585, partial [Bacillus paranthracis]